MPAQPAPWPPTVRRSRQPDAPRRRLRLPPRPAQQGQNKKPRQRVFERKLRPGKLMGASTRLASDGGYNSERCTEVARAP